LKQDSNKRIGLLALIVFVIDQAAKTAVLRYLGHLEEREIVPGFFKLVHWRNTGAAWSMFHNNNELLAIVALVALLVLFLSRHRFEIDTRLGWIAMGLLFGGIAGNLADRLMRGHVIDFLYFFTHRASGREIGFPAFNVADSAICVGVGLLFVLSFRKEPAREQAPAAVPDHGVANKASPGE